MSPRVRVQKYRPGCAKVFALPSWHQNASVERLAENVDIAALHAQNAVLVASLDVKLLALEQEIAWLLNQAPKTSPQRERLAGEVVQFVDQVQAITGRFSSASTIKTDE